MFLSWILLTLPVFLICHRYWGSKVKKRGTFRPSQSLHSYGEKAQTNQITWKSETENLSPGQASRWVWGRGTEACVAPSARPPGLSCGLLTSQTWNSSCPRLFAFLCDSLIFCFLSFPKSFFCVCVHQPSFIIQPRLVECHRLVFNKVSSPHLLQAAFLGPSTQGLLLLCSW